MSSIWSILGIAQTADSRLIKKAYSTKLKQVRPDEKPDEFQQLHAAYKSALQQARWLSEQATNQPTRESHAAGLDITNQAEQEFQEPTYQQHDEQITSNNLRLDYETADSFEYNQPKAEQMELSQHASSESSGYQEEIDRIISGIDRVIMEGNAFNVDSWKFVLESEYILDQNFFDDLGLAVLRRIASYYNKEEFREQGDFGINEDVLHHLNSIFRWDNYEYDYSFYLQNQFGIQQFDTLKGFEDKIINPKTDITGDLRGAKSIKKVFKYSSTPFKYYYYGGNGKRFMAMTIDMLLALSIASLVYLASEIVIGHKLTFARNFNSYIVFTIYLIGSWLFESSSHQATPGKKLLGLRVVNSNQIKLGYLHGLLRVGIFAVTSIGFYITAIINARSDGKYIHDRFSRSYVMDLWRTRKEHKKRA